MEPVGTQQTGEIQVDLLPIHSWRRESFIKQWPFWSQNQNNIAELGIAGPLAAMVLTHWGRDKMATIFADCIFKCIVLNEKNMNFY